MTALTMLQFLREIECYDEKWFAELNGHALRAEYAALLAENKELERKGLLLCNQNGDLLMQNAALRNRFADARKIIEHAANIETGIKSGTQVTVHYTGTLEKEAEAWLKEEE